MSIIVFFFTRNVIRYMKQRNIIGTSKGYVDRILDSDSSVTPEDVQKYFLSTLKYMKLYEEVRLFQSKILSDTLRMADSAKLGKY